MAEEENWEVYASETQKVPDGSGIDLKPGPTSLRAGGTEIHIFFVFVFVLTSFCLEKQSSVDFHPVRELPAKTNICALAADIYSMLMFH